MAHAGVITVGRSIKLDLLAPIAGLSGLLLFVDGRQSVEAWHKYTAAESVQQFDAGANKFVAGLYEVLLPCAGWGAALNA